MSTLILQCSVQYHYHIIKQTDSFHKQKRKHVLSLVNSTLPLEYDYYTSWLIMLTEHEPNANELIAMSLYLQNLLNNTS